MVCKISENLTEKSDLKTRPPDLSRVLTLHGEHHDVRSETHPCYHTGQSRG